MKRRAWIAAAAALGGCGLLTPAAAAARMGVLRSSPRMPVLFVGHGSPMNAIEDNAFRRGWQALGAEFGRRYPRPQLILCISAHWLTRGFLLTGMAQPKTIHDFQGFPQVLFEQQYPAPGSPAAAAEIARGILQPPLALDPDQWGFDHGAWSVLKPMFPAADIPVLQLSLDFGRGPAAHFALGRELRALRERGVLIVGSGNIVHNLRATRRGAGRGDAHDWALEFDHRTRAVLEQGNLEALPDFRKLGRLAQLAHPTYEHYLPLLHAAGAADAQEAPRFFNEGFQSASVSMRSVVWG